MQTDDLNRYVLGLIRRVLLLDPAAYQEFALLFGPMLKDHMLHKGLPAPEADRLAADSLNAGLGRIEQYRPEGGPFAAWILALADRRHQAWLRRLCGFQRDLEAAATTQAAFLPGLRPSVAGLDVCFCHRPLRLVTGDFCDILPSAGGGAMISMGDASGKGASAAMYGILAQAWVRAFARPNLNPVQFLSQLDGALKGFRAGSQYATLLLSVWHPGTSKFVISSAGAPFPAVLRGGELVWVRTAGTALGWPTPADFEQIELPVSPGDLVVFYSDGIPDQSGPEGGLFGDQGFEETLRRSGQSDVEQVAQILFADLDQFRGDVEQGDDQMLLVMRVQ